MLKNISQKLKLLLQKEKQFTEANIQTIIHEIQSNLLESDVHHEVVDLLIQSIKSELIGKKISKKADISEVLMQLFYEKLLDIVGNDSKFLKVFEKEKLHSILFIGLQGSGKTTNIAKLALFLKQKYPYAKILLCSSDKQRPMAQEQLRILAEKASIDFFNADSIKTPTQVASEALKYAKKNAYQYLLMDTAGRLDIDESLMKELVEISKILNPDTQFFVIDAMYGQNVLNIFKEFHRKLNINHILVSKYDSDSHAGMVLSVKTLFDNITISFIGTGENLEDLEEFHPNQFVKEILGYGNLEKLVQKIEKNIQDPEKNLNQILDQGLTLNDYLLQIQQIKKLGKFKNIIGMIPGFNEHMQGKEDQAEKIMRVQESMILSMTPRERKNFLLVQSNISRKKRILKGSGRSLEDINKLIKQFSDMQKIFKKMKNNNSLFKNFNLPDTLNLFKKF